MRVRVLDEQTNEFTTGHIADVIDSGMQQVYRVTTDDGRSIEMTARHRFLTPEGWKTLRDIATIEGSDVTLNCETSMMANGAAAHRDPEWLARQRQAGRTVSEIAEDAGVSYHTIRTALKKHNLQFSKEERGFAPGNVPWNAGRPGYAITKPRSKAHRMALSQARSGERSNFWRGGVSSERSRIAAWTRGVAPIVHARFDYTCQACNKRGGELHVHHVLPVWFAPDRARDIENLVSVCRPCHREIHSSTMEELGFASATRPEPLPPLAEVPPSRGRRLVAHAVRIVSVTYVGTRQTYDLSIAGPWHNFVANGLVVHNSFNEQSARYSEIPDHYYVPSLEGGYVREQKGKPGAYFFDAITDADVAADTVRTIDETQRASFAAYHHMLEQGVAKELARTVLPVGMFTRMKWTVNLRALFNFLSLRNHEHAQREIRDYAVAVEDLAKTVVPVAFEVFEKNGRVTP